MRSLIKDAVIMLISVAIYLGLGMGVYSTSRAGPKSVHLLLHGHHVDSRVRRPVSELAWFGGTIFMIFFGIIGIFSQVMLFLRPFLFSP